MQFDVASECLPFDADDRALKIRARQVAGFTWVNNLQRVTGFGFQPVNASFRARFCQAGGHHAFR